MCFSHHCLHPLLGWGVSSDAHAHATHFSTPASKNSQQEGTACEDSHIIPSLIYIPQTIIQRHPASTLNSYLISPKQKLYTVI